MLAAFTDLKNAQKVKEFLIKKNLLHRGYYPSKELDHIFFPITKNAKVPNARIVDTNFDFDQNKKPLSLEDLLKDELTRKELSLIPRSQEIVGKIMILEVPQELEKKEKRIAQAYLKTNKQIETVVKKDQIHSGTYRLRKVKILAGKRTKETLHHENGVELKIDLENTYFSARSANERLRIAKQVRKGESVLVMFSGAAPYPLVIAKNSKAKEIVGIEINSMAHRLAVDNTEMNRMFGRVKIFNDDVNLLLPKMRKKFDRIVMPLPKTGELFLPLALKRSKPGTLIHLYAFLEEKEIPAEAKKIKQIAEPFKINILRHVKCGQFSPYVFRVCFDIKIIKKN